MGEEESSGSNYGYNLYWDEIKLNKKSERILIMEKLEKMAEAKNSNIKWALEEISNIESDIKFLKSKK